MIPKGVMQSVTYGGLRNNADVDNYFLAYGGYLCDVSGNLGGIAFGGFPG